MTFPAVKCSFHFFELTKNNAKDKSMFLIIQNRVFSFYKHDFYTKKIFWMIKKINLWQTLAKTHKNSLNLLQSKVLNTGLKTMS